MASNDKPYALEMAFQASVWDDGIVPPASVSDIDIVRNYEKVLNP